MWEVETEMFSFCPTGQIEIHWYPLVYLKVFSSTRILAKFYHCNTDTSYESKGKHPKSNVTENSSIS
jgi:hypothetical protein